MASSIELVRVAEIVANATSAQNVNILATAIAPKLKATSMRIAVVATAVKLRLVPSTGSAFYLNAGAALTLDTLLVQDVPVDRGRTFNLQTDDAAGITVKHLIVDLLHYEQPLT